MLRNIKAVLFDLDGTLIDSMWIWKHIDIEYLKSKGIIMPQDLQRKIEGMSMRETAYYFKENFHIEDEIEIMMHTWNTMAMDTYKHKVTFKPGALEFLKYLKKHHIKCGIATSNSKELLAAVSEKLSLAAYIDCFLTGNEVAHGKPWPDIYLEVAKRLQVQPEECLVFEDIVPGILAGKRANMHVCAVEDSYSVDQIADKKALADYYIKTYDDVERNIGC